MPELQWADYIILALVLLSTIIGIVRGFVREAISLATWVLAFWLAYMFTTPVSNVLAGMIGTPSLRLGVAFLAIFIVVLIIGAIINYIIGQLVDKTGFSGTDRVIGFVFGVARGLLVIALLVLLAGITPFPQDSWWRTSYFIPQIQVYVTRYMSELPPDIAKHFSYAGPGQQAGTQDNNNPSSQAGSEAENKKAGVNAQIDRQAKPSSPAKDQP